MYRLLTKFGLALAALLFLAASAQAQGLGRLTLLSAIGQPLHAEVAIVSVPSGKETGLYGSIAKPETYKEMGVDFDALMFSIRVSVESRSSGPVLVLKSSRTVNEPYLNVIVVLQSAGGQLVRNYTVFLDSQ